MTCAAEENPCAFLVLALGRMREALDRAETAVACVAADGSPSGTADLQQIDRARQIALDLEAYCRVLEEVGLEDSERRSRAAGALRLEELRNPGRTSAAATGEPTLF